MTFHIITLFPHAFDSYLGESILKRAIEDKKIKVKFYNPRDFESDPKWRIDDKPYGGGPGMVMRALPVVKAIQKALGKNRLLQKKEKKVKIIFLSPRGKQFDTTYAKKVAQKYTDIIFICGRYEGIDARVLRIFRPELLSIGSYVVTGGELPAMMMIDCISRQIEGVLGDINSLEENRISSSEVYTRPEVFTYKNKKYKVPKILLSGNHKKIDVWRISRSMKSLDDIL